MNEKIFRALELWKVKNREDAYWIVLLKEKCEPEPIPVRILKIEKEFFLGELLEEPIQALGYHAGDHVGFEIYEDIKENIIFIASLNDDMSFRLEELSDGRLLKCLLESFRMNPTEDALIDVIDVVRNSEFWIPYAITVDRQKKEHMRVDVIFNGYEKMIPVFTSKDEMGGYGNSVYKSKRHFLEVVKLVKKHDEMIGGIVINPFSEEFMVKKDLFDILENLSINNLMS